MYLDKLISWLTSDNDAALLTSEVSKRYLTDFGSEDGTLLVTKGGAYFIIDARYFEHTEQQVTDPLCKVILQKDLYEQLGELFNKHNISTLYIEDEYMNVAQLSALKRRFSGVNVDTSNRLSDFMSSMRIIKTDEEIACITKAQRIAEAAFTKLLSNMRVGQTEKQIAAYLEFFMMEMGSDGISFDTIAASGVNSACPHAVPTDKPVKDGDFLTLDFGATYKGYHSDMTRTVVFGKPTDEMKNIYNAVWGANTDAIKAVRADISCKVVDSVARSTLDAWGYEEYFTHGLGHGVGLEIHEAPSVSSRSGTTLKEGMIITIEPGVYIPGKYGVRIEDMCVVTKDGCKIITETPKTLIYI
ncbi:MAG: aminopeptidase P family protein [Firmicutes bacterium]|nr:aminopeptidase P family protein [[Eubacterium] siraeum]MCM1488508.1 aminopeptidase P family protein [Bacillota bacterium]